MVPSRHFFAFVFIALTIIIAMLFGYQVVYADHCDPGYHHSPDNPEECIPNEVAPKPTKEPKDKPTKTPIYIPPTFTATSTETQTPTPTSTITETSTPTRTATTTRTPTLEATVSPQKNTSDDSSDDYASFDTLLPLLLLGGYGGYHAGGRGCRRNRGGNLYGQFGGDDLLSLAILGISAAFLTSGDASSFSTSLPLLLLTGGAGGYLGHRRCRRRRRGLQGPGGGYGNQGGLGGYY